MADIPFTNYMVLDAFKKEIDYPSIVSKVDESKKVLANWKDIVRFVPKDGVKWESHNNVIGITGTGEGRISDYFIYKDKNISFNIYVLNGKTNREALDRALLLGSNVSLNQVPYKYLEKGPGDFYFHNQQAGPGGIDRDAVCVYKNIIIEISTVSNNIDVRDVVAYLVGEAEKHLIGPNEIPALVYTKSQSSNKIKPGDSFTIGLKIPEANRIKYQVEPSLGFPGEGIEYLSDVDGQFELKAHDPGAYDLRLWIMDSDNLYAEEASFSIQVQN